MNDTFASRLRAVRGKESREIFAQKLGISARALVNYEYDERMPKGTTIAQICARLGINIEWLVSGTGPMYKEVPNSQNDVLAPKTTDTSDVLDSKKIQHIDFNSLKEKKTTDVSDVLDSRQEFADLNRDLREAYREIVTLNRQNGDLRVELERQRAQFQIELREREMDIERRDARIRELEQQLMEARAAVKPAGAAHQTGGRVG